MFNPNTSSEVFAKMVFVFKNNSDLNFQINLKTIYQSPHFPPSSSISIKKASQKILYQDFKIPESQPLPKSAFSDNKILTEQYFDIENSAAALELNESSILRKNTLKSMKKKLKEAQGLKYYEVLLCRINPRQNYCVFVNNAKEPALISIVVFNMINFTSKLQIYAFYYYYFYDCCWCCWI
jgi:hypothetical protein